MNGQDDPETPSHRPAGAFDMSWPSSNPGHPRLIEEQVSLQSIKTFLDAAAWDTRFDGDDDLYVHGGVEFPFWISLDANVKHLALFTYWSADFSVSSRVINQINTQYRMVQFFVKDKKVCASYYMTFKFGLDMRQLVVIGRHFSSVCQSSFNELNPAFD
jgi:hypothetical protein